MRMRGNARNVFPAADFKGNRLLAIPTCITACMSHTCHDACRDRKHAVARKTSQQSLCMRNPQFYVSGKRPKFPDAVCDLVCFLMFGSDRIYTHGSSGKITDTWTIIRWSKDHKVPCLIKDSNALKAEIIHTIKHGTTKQCAHNLRQCVRDHHCVILYSINTTGTLQYTMIHSSQVGGDQCHLPVYGTSSSIPAGVQCHPIYMVLHHMSTAVWMTESPFIAHFMSSLSKSWKIRMLL